MLDVGCWMFDVRCSMLDVGCWMLDVGCWMFDVGCWMFDVGHLRCAGHFAADGLDCLIRPDKKFQLHLLELARAEREVARVDFVAKRFSDLADAKRHLLA